jgi:hypothetical protein
MADDSSKPIDPNTIKTVLFCIGGREADDARRMDDEPPVIRRPKMAG